MKCPLCGNEHTHLSWLREFTVIYWCAECHAGFDVDRHQVRSVVTRKLTSETDSPAR